jgi:hypothetical protein
MKRGNQEGSKEGYQVGHLKRTHNIVNEAKQAKTKYYYLFTNLIAYPKGRTSRCSCIAKLRISLRDERIRHYPRPMPVPDEENEGIKEQYLESGKNMSIHGIEWNTSSRSVAIIALAIEEKNI